jgi:hypothetical protein
MKRWYSVTSPRWEYTEYYPELGGGPTEDIADWCVVWARTRRDAERAAVKHWLRRCRAERKWPTGECCWPHHQRRDAANPFTGLHVARVPDEWQEEWNRAEWDAAVR